ncbi:MAG: hypothetical protein EA392_00390 [Cryomorphaceae bacterium]|nr:MAG: hypothetical protein EA392_00390 [Cryomorphaceae bacterium]
MSNIDFSALTFTAEQVRDLAELIRLERVEAGPFAQFHDVHTGIRYNKEIGFIGEAGLVGKTDLGCDSVADQLDIPVKKKVWEPNRFRIFLKECYKDLDDTLALYARRTGTPVSDLTGTDYLNLVEQLAGEAVQKMLWRTWLMDTDATNVGAGAGTELITAAVPVAHFNLIDGYWSQIADIVAANPTQQTVVTANATATKAEQFDDLTPALAFEYLMNATYNMPVELVRQQNKIGMITRYFANQVKKQFQTTNTHPEAYQAVKDGVDILMVNGIEFAIQDDWTEQILAYNDLGARWHLPHRAIITTKENLAYGIETESGFATFDTFFDKVTDYSYIKMLDSIDVKVLQDRLIQVIY